MLIALCNKNEKVLFSYESSIIPRKGELVNLPHRGTFRILEIAYRIADDVSWSTKDLLMYVEVIVDFENQITDI